MHKTYAFVSWRFLKSRLFVVLSLRTFLFSKYYEMLKVSSVHYCCAFLDSTSKLSSAMMIVFECKKATTHVRCWWCCLRASIWCYFYSSLYTVLTVRSAVCSSWRKAEQLTDRPVKLNDAFNVARKWFRCSQAERYAASCRMSCSVASINNIGVVNWWCDGCSWLWVSDIVYSCCQRSRSSTQWNVLTVVCGYTTRLQFTILFLTYAAFEFPR